jgi:hypothetical protein
VHNASVTLIGKPGCHLCDDAEAIVRSVLQDYPDVAFTLADLGDNPEWEAHYAEKIPVVLVNNVEHAFWRVNSENFRAELDIQKALSSDANSE